ncbi:helix-hairpin-helix domain-containing protein [Salinispora fenicalii]|uniref:helix-hairpin-helix domain-containing protein n=1 Tax=Salinispora fenicalii TaxID=1137263 RepID=UPI0004896B4E|nr:helix-hairpin-helix domain-containing protein [Salinispora fenicalii]
MAWSDWPLIVVALLVGAAAGWVVRGRRNAARAGNTAEATPVSTTTTAVGEPASTSADTSTSTSTSTDRSSATESAPEQTAAAPEQTAPASAQTDPAADPEHAPVADSSQPAPGAADTVAPPVVAPPPAASETELAEVAPVATEPGHEPGSAAPELEPDAADDFRRIQGIGPKMAAALQAAGIRTYQQLAELDEPALRDLIRGAGLRGAASLPTWPQQAKVLAATVEPAGAPATGGSAGA